MNPAGFSNEKLIDLAQQTSARLESFAGATSTEQFDMKQHLLFVCSGNLNRSPTAESLFLNSRFYEAKSAGTDPNAVVRVSQELIDWADVVFVMSEKEDGHLTFIENNFSVKDKLISDLDVPDIYDRGDPELIGLLRKKIEEFMLLRGYPVYREYPANCAHTATHRQGFSYREAGHSESAGINRHVVGDERAPQERRIANPSWPRVLQETPRGAA